ncbi:MAG TPA: PqqD family protein [Clostridia bacterium]|nr:PqqD family protein [Clostridia bacterium]
MSYQIIHLHRKQGFVVRKVGDARMVIPTGPRMKEYKGVITINETGAFLFDLVKEPQTLRQAMDALIAEYGIDENTAYDAVAAFAHQCNEANLLVVEEMEQLPQGRSFMMSEETAEALKQEATSIKTIGETGDGKTEDTDASDGQ